MYQKFAEIYDELMKEAPYEEWLTYLLAIIDKQLVKPSSPSLMVDLGCGTGTLTTMMANNGLEMIGIDLSDEMLNIARHKWDLEKSGSEGISDILYLQQDMEALELFGSVDVIVSMCDSLNYITESDSLKKVFAKCFYYLNPGGIMVFDLNTAYKFREEIADQTFAENFEDYSYIWENYFDEDTGVHEYGVTMFVASEKGYKKFEEFHYEQVYDSALIKDMVVEQGFEVIDINGDMGASPIEEASKHYFIIKKPEVI